MDLQIGQSIDNNRVRLDFRKSPSKPTNSPSYVIERDLADEFVNQYNKQEEKLLKNIKRGIVAFAVVGWGVSIWKKSLKMALMWVPLGILAGLGIGAIVSAHHKNNLMDKYQVREYSVRSYF